MAKNRLSFRRNPRVIWGSVLLYLVCMMLAVRTSAQSREELLLSGWRFQRGEVPDAQTAEFDDSRWEKISIPHDWAIAGPFDKEVDKQVTIIEQDGEKIPTEHTGRTGSLPWIGEGWYRRTIFIPEGYSSGELILDGAMAEPHVWVNGHDVGFWAYGYTTFSLDFSKAIPTENGLLKAGEYQVAIHLQTRPGSSRWYPGAGIYRPVRLILHKEHYLCSFETFARTTRLEGISPDATSASRASLTVSNTIGSVSNGQLKFRLTLQDSEGSEVCSMERSLRKGFAESTMVLEASNVQLWSTEHPVLYTLTTQLLEGDRLWDSRTTKVGFRMAEYNTKGFFLNGQPEKFRGVCMHHDLGSLGIAFYKDAFRRQVRLLKDMGCNAIRTSHNIPCPWQLDICDEMGMMVMAESFDTWKAGKCENDYQIFFDEVDSKSVNADGRKWYQRDITNLVKVNRNHPSVVMWSIGNEVPDQGSPFGLFVTKDMQHLVHNLDGTRPCTMGANNSGACIEVGMWQEFDIPGMNYNLRGYEWGEKNSASGIVLGTETSSTISSRGVYRFPVKEEVHVVYPDRQETGYDLVPCAWGELPDDDWMLQDKDPRVIGEFVWSGFDYLGEPTPYYEKWPSRSSYFGIYDLAGLPKDRVWLYRTHWAPEKETLHLLPHWTWPKRQGELTPVFCYTNYPEAELFVNGKSQGRRKHIDMSIEEWQKNPVSVDMPWGGQAPFPNPDAEPNRLDRYRMRWMDVVYEPGELKVVAYDAKGNKAAEKILRTAGKPHHLELISDRKSMPATPLDEAGNSLDTPSLTYFTVRVVDKDGNLCPDAETQVSFKVSGTGARFNSCCNGDATSLEVFTNSTMKAFHGLLVATIESTSEKGTVLFTASAKGLKSASETIVIE